MYARPSKILIIDDDVELVTLLVDYFTLEGFEASPAHSGIEGLQVLEHKEFDLIILDVMMPGISGVETLQRIREKWRTPVLMLTARGDPVDRILGLELGADDYVPKPCSPRELVARIRAILRRTHAIENQDDGVVRVADLVLDEDAHEVYRAEVEVDLSPTEFKLLRYLMLNAGRVVSKAQILDHVWEYDWNGDAAIVESYISYLRRKVDQIQGADGQPVTPLIQTRRGVGYMLREPKAE